ncbi:hypothetical protein NLJ89_g3089 [Agrocybe chaxingu]|uniref:Uncharacterized protein n=1 Tax=Agrocybe chaxingu TaxID=84603 RepID=A0A9W8K5K2_9AGAR|nr:hypothetical protein NLJ89_g3089 [Agrocybe chaxingu]
MGRRRLYHTDEERKAANRLKSKRYYDIAKDDINKRRRKRYNKKKSTGSLNHLNKTPQQIDSLTTGVDTCLAPYAFVNSICKNFLANRDKDEIHKQTIALGKFRKSIQKYQDLILQECGIGDQWSEVEGVRKQICETLSLVEEVFCYALVDWDEVRRLHAEKGLVYQALAK